MYVNADAIKAGGNRNVNSSLVKFIWESYFEGSFPGSLADSVEEEK